ncbi:MAG: hypothetical protein ABIQ73_26490 [Acidimicrobiales bacterium]
MRSRTGRFLTTQVPELAGLSELGYRMVLDGELVAVSGDNVDFYALGQRMLTRRATRTVTLCAFDVLWLDGIDCTQLPYRDRRLVLELSGPAWCQSRDSPSTTPKTYSTRVCGCGKKASS